MGKLKAVFTIPELRQKIFITLLFLAIYRIGFHVPLPFVDQIELAKKTGQRSGALAQVLGVVSLFSGGNLQSAPSSPWASCRTSPPPSFSNSSRPSIRLWRS